MNSGLIRTCAILFLAFSPVAVKSQQTAPDVICSTERSLPATPHIPMCKLSRSEVRLFAFRNDLGWRIFTHAGV